MGMQLVRPQRAVVARRPSPAQRKAVRSIASVESASRREAGAGVLAGAAALAPPAGADGVLGIGGKTKSKKYYDETYDVINQVEYTISLDKDDPSKDDAVGQTRRMTNEWVAKWRREKDFSGRPSFSNVYSSLNAISGHYNNFGTRYPLPKRRSDRITQELSDAKKFLERDR